MPLVYVSLGDTYIFTYSNTYPLPLAVAQIEFHGDGSETHHLADGIRIEVDSEVSERLGESVCEPVRPAEHDYKSARIFISGA